eukprot:7626074-Alexandrium_andersonii.AAC.1
MAGKDDPESDEESSYTDGSTSSTDESDAKGGGKAALTGPKPLCPTCINTEIDMFNDEAK